MLKPISMDVAAATVLSELGGIFKFKEEQRKALEGFTWWKICFLLVLAGVYSKTAETLGSEPWLMLPLAPTGRLYPIWLNRQ